MGYYYSLYYSSCAECGAFGRVIHIQAEEAQPNSQREAWQRVQTSDSRSDARQQVPG